MKYSQELKIGLTISCLGWCCLLACATAEEEIFTLRDHDSGATNGGSGGNATGGVDASGDVMFDDALNDLQEPQDTGAGGKGGSGGATGKGGAGGKGGSAGKGGSGGTGGFSAGVQCGDTYCPRWDCKIVESGVTLVVSPCCVTATNECGASNAADGGLICVSPVFFETVLNMTCEPENS